MSDTPKTVGFKLDLDGGKYIYIRYEFGGQEALRYGEPWRDLTGDNLILFFGFKVEELMDRNSQLERELRIAELKNRGSLANNLCPDHRDKQTGKLCLACRIETLERELNHANSLLLVAGVEEETFHAACCERDEFKRQAALYNADTMKVMEQRDQWKAMAQELADAVYGHDTTAVEYTYWQKRVSVALSRFSELNKGNAFIPSHQTLAVALKRYATHRTTCATQLENNDCSCGLAALIKQTEELAFPNPK